MNAPANIDSPLSNLRVPFSENHISKLPKPTKAQTEAVKADFKKGIRCKICGSWHHPEVIHLDYVGHAALTDRLLDTDIEWHWEPLAFTDLGLPAFDQTGGLWIKLTVAGVTRLGYGHAAAKPNADPGAREKEVIGDALRNAAMRFGAALDLWHKGDLHVDNGEAGQSQGGAVSPPADTLRDQLTQSLDEPATRDMPFPQGPAKNKTELKAMGRALWREIEGCGDDLEMSCLLGVPENVELVKQLMEALPAWWTGYEKDGELHDGLADVISRKEKEFTLVALERAE